MTGRSSVRSLMALAALFASWWAVAAFAGLPGYLLPSPVAVVQRIGFLARSADLAAHLSASATELLAGFALGAIAGAVLSSVFAHMPRVERATSPLIILLQTAPKIALAPLLILWMGFGPAAKIVLVAVVTFLPVLAGGLAAVRGIPATAWDLARILALSPARRFLSIEAPYALPGILAGMRIGSTQAVTAVVVGELLGTKLGLGVLLSMGQENNDAATVLAVVAVLSALGYLLYAAVGLLERQLLGWHESQIDRDVVAT